MKRTLIAAAILGLALAAHADSSNGDPSDRGGPNDMFTDPASNCIEQSNAAFLAHFFPEHSFGGICGFVPPPSPSPVPPPASPPPGNAVPEPGSLWLFALALAIVGMFNQRKGKS